MTEKQAREILLSFLLLGAQEPVPFGLVLKTLTLFYQLFCMRRVWSCINIHPLCIIILQTFTIIIWISHLHLSRFSFHLLCLYLQHPLCFSFPTLETCSPLVRLYGPCQSRTTGPTLGRRVGTVFTRITPPAPTGQADEQNKGQR